MNIDKYIFKGYPKQNVPEKRFLIRFENLDILKRLSGYEVAEMVDCQVSDEVRTRKISIKGKEHYFRTKEELEEPISKEAFEESCENMHHLYRLVYRTRYAFSDGILSAAILAGIPVTSEDARGIFMMLDTFDLWKDFGILTVKGAKVSELNNFDLPEIEILKEITDDKTYCTKSMATIDYTSFLE